MALFFRGRPATEARSSNLPELIDAATGGRRGLAGRPVGWAGSLAIPAVWAAVRLRANIISSLPVQVFRDGPDGRPVRVPTPGPLDRPSVDFDITSWLSASQLSLDLRGNAYGRILAREPRTNLPTQVELVHPDDVQVDVGRDGFIRYRFGGREVDSLDVWHERQNEAPGSVVGMSPISAAARSLGVNLSAADYGAEFYTDALTASGLLSSDAPIDEVQARIAKARVRAAQQGREPLVLGGNWTYKPLTVAPAEAMFLDVLRFGAEDAARLFDVPGEFIGAPAGGSSLTYANREQRMQDLLALRLGPAIARRERALSRFTVRGQYVKLNTGSLLRADLMTRYNSYKLGMSSGFLAEDEARAFEDREPLTDEQIARLKDLGVLGKPAAPAAAASADGTNPVGVVDPAVQEVPA